MRVAQPKETALDTRVARFGLSALPERVVGLEAGLTLNVDAHAASAA